MKFDRSGVNALMEITSRPELVFVRGQGSWLEDHNGKRYLDFIQGWAVNCLGHCPPDVVEAINEQSTLLINPSPAFYNVPSMELAKRLTGASCFDRVFFANSGAEANEGAIKLARKWGRLNRKGAFKIITFDHSFHGRTLATMSASGKPGWDKIFAPQVDGFPKAHLNDLESVRALIDDQTVAIMLEPVQGEAGVIPASPEFMQALRALADQHGLLLIVDEVQTGMGRTGKLFAYEHSGITPDIMTLGKGIGAGVPLAALCARESVSCFDHGDQGGTYNGNPLMTAAGVAVFDALTADGFMESVNVRSTQLSEGLLALSAKWGMKGERGQGLLRALILDRDDGAAIVETARDWAPEGMLLNAPRPNLLRFMPALNVTAEEVELMLERLDEVISQVRR
ncbi:acetylornithine transaminase [Candidimonas sp. SYP-B2681]|uniref:acetylornithine transaminase n=1 Tax=Candidimonas sp. SYP-B2681 TaxID=2497686 RepID=UPI000F867216|nr:acetylornithine transaminase [Candidimonas sp. SYP-B2681]RTZ43360.1 acetylornithine transaminase [Candidimonas sp. SYP-B2681]